MEKSVKELVNKDTVTTLNRAQRRSLKKKAQSELKHLKKEMKVLPKNINDSYTNFIEACKKDGVDPTQVFTDILAVDEAQDLAARDAIKQIENLPNN